MSIVDSFAVASNPSSQDSAGAPCAKAASSEAESGGMGNPKTEESNPNAPRVSDVTELSPAYQAQRRSLDYLAEQLRELGTGSSPEQMFRLGELVHRALKADTTAASDERKQKASLRRIAAHPGVPFKVTTLWRAASVYEMSLRLPHLLHVKGLGISHLRAVIGLDPADQEQLLGLAIQEEWTKRRLEREAARRREGRRRRGRRPTPKVTLWTRELQRVLARSSEVEDGFDEMDAAMRGDLGGVLEDIEAQCRSLRARIEAR